MKVYSIFVRVYWQNPNWEPTLVARYIDSQWALEESAHKRKKELEDSFSAFGCHSTTRGATCLIVAGSVTDVALQQVDLYGDDDDDPPPSPSSSK